MKETEDVLRALTNVRNAIPERLKDGRRHEPGDERPSQLLLADDDLDVVLEEFDEKVVLDSLEQVTAEVSSAVNVAEGRLLAHALKIYYAAEELSRDPAHSHLIPIVEGLRRTFEEEYGYPIPEL